MTATTETPVTKNYGFEELPKVESVTIHQSGDVYLKDQALMEEMLQQLADYRKRNEALKAEVDRLNKSALESSVAFEEQKGLIMKLRAQLVTSNIHLFKMLDEHEGAFDSDEKFASAEICRDYLDAAIYCEKQFGRVGNKVPQAQEWYDNLMPWEQTDKLKK